MLRSDALDSERKPMSLVERYAYSDAGTLLSNRHEDQQGQLRTGAKGEAELRIEPDRYGNIQRIGYYSTAGAAVINLDGYAFAQTAYNERGHPIEYCYFDAAGEAIAIHGIHCSRYQRDAHGWVQHEEEFGVDGQLIGGGEGEPAIYDFRFDGHGNQIELRSFDRKRQPVDHYGAIQRNEYDVQGNPVALRFLDAGGHPELTPYGAAFLLKLDARGNEIERVAVGLDGRPVIASA